MELLAVEHIAARTPVHNASSCAEHVQGAGLEAELAAGRPDLPRTDGQPAAVAVDPKACDRSEGEKVDEEVAGIVAADLPEPTSAGEGLLQHQDVPHLAAGSKLHHRAAAVLAVEQEQTRLRIQDSRKLNAGEQSSLHVQVKKEEMEVLQATTKKPQKSTLKKGFLDSSPKSARVDRAADGADKKDGIPKQSSRTQLNVDHQSLYVQMEKEDEMDVVEALKAVESEARMPTMLKPPAKLPSLDRYSEDQAKQKPIWGLTGAFARRSPVELSPTLKALKGAQGRKATGSDDDGKATAKKPQKSTLKKGFLRAPSSARVDRASAFREMTVSSLPELEQVADDIEEEMARMQKQKETLRKPQKMKMGSSKKRGKKKETIGICDGRNQDLLTQEAQKLLKKASEAMPLLDEMCAMKKSMVPNMPEELSRSREHFSQLSPEDQKEFTQDMGKHALGGDLSSCGAAAVKAEMEAAENLGMTTMMQDVFPMLPKDLVEMRSACSDHSAHPQLFKILYGLYMREEGGGFAVSLAALENVAREKCQWRLQVVCAIGAIGEPEANTGKEMQKAGLEELNTLPPLRTGYVPVNKAYEDMVAQSRGSQAVQSAFQMHDFRMNRIKINAIGNAKEEHALFDAETQYIHERFYERELRLQASSDEERELTKNSDMHEQLAAGLTHSAGEVRRWGSSSLQSLLECDDDHDGDDKETLPECSIHSQLRLGSKEEEIFQYSFDNMLRTARRRERFQQDQLASPKTYPDVLLNYDETKCATCPFPCTSAHELTAGGAGPGLTSVTGAWWSSALPPPRPAKMLSKPTGSCIAGRKKLRATISLSLRHAITRGGLSIAPPPEHLLVLARHAKPFVCAAAATSANSFRTDRPSICLAATGVCHPPTWGAGFV
eukprot:COSAG04_NODE_191_length_20909_cov_11.119077_15_plen_891_part_00